jgi:hypothetical protein
LPWSIEDPGRRRPGRAPRARSRKYERAWRVHAERQLGRKRVLEVTTQDIIDRLWKQEPKREKPRRRSSSGANSGESPRIQGDNDWRLAPGHGRESPQTTRATDPNEPGRPALPAPTLVAGRAGSLPPCTRPSPLARGQAAGGGACSRGCSSWPPRSAFHRCANGVLAGASRAFGYSCRVSLRSAQTPRASNALKTSTNCHR